MLKNLSVIAAVAVVVCGCWFYTSKRKVVASKKASEMATERLVSAEGVKKDLLSFAHAEQAYKTSHGRYASEGQLYASGELKAQKPARDGYTYSWESSMAGFSVIARCQIQPSASCPSFAIDQSMQLQPLP